MLHLEKSLTGRILVLIGASTMLVSGCSRTVEQPQGVQQSTAPQQLSVPPTVSINELMVAWIDHSGHELWDVEARRARSEDRRGLARGRARTRHRWRPPEH